MRGEAVSEVGRIGGALPKCGASAWKSDCPQPGECKPCSWYFSSPAPCPRGATCPFCHVHNQKRSVRPCKSKRRSLEKAIAKIDQLFLADPANITSHFDQLPSACKNDPFLLAECRAYMANILARHTSMVFSF
mmetsp:Transcript_58228/g.169039  ORF Transcript_58228/g.169039 Transcript_58228/m.169039 type:complete len:133 (+) Transcript_58228:21-419(+)